MHEQHCLDLRRDAADPSGVADAGKYGAVLVLNDGCAGTLRRLRLALALRDRHPQLQVGMVSYLENRPVDAVTSCVAGGVHAPLALAELAPELKVEFKDRVLNLEYQAV